MYLYNILKETQRYPNSLVSDIIIFSHKFKTDSPIIILGLLYFDEWFYNNVAIKLRFLYILILFIKWITISNCSNVLRITQFDK